MEQEKDSIITENVNLRETIKKTYNISYWIMVFLLIPTIGHYFVPWKFIPYARDIGILICVIWLRKITKRMKQKEKELKSEELSKEVIN